MITRRASVATQKRPDVSRASFVHVVVPRTEQRCADGEKRPHSVYLVRLLSHLGDYPTTDTFYELRYSRVAELHTHLRAEHPGLRLPWLPRARWLGSKHPAYVSEMREEIERYLRQLLTHWLRSYGGFDSFIMLRRMALLAWTGSHAGTDLARSQAPHFAAGTARLAEAYLARFA